MLVGTPGNCPVYPRVKTELEPSITCRFCQGSYFAGFYFNICVCSIVQFVADFPSCLELISSIIYSFIPVIGCVGKGPSALF
jgi:hypothetical protein